MESSAGAGIYVTTWDHDAEGRYMATSGETGQRIVGNTPPGAPTVMDDLFLHMPDGYVTGSSGMSYCNQTPFPLREGWGLGTRLGGGLKPA